MLNYRCSGLYGPAGGFQGIWFGDLLAEVTVAELWTLFIVVGNKDYMQIGQAAALAHLDP